MHLKLTWNLGNTSQSNNTDPANPLAMFLGIGFAAAWAWFKGGITVPVAGAIAIVYVVLQVN